MNSLGFSLLRRDSEGERRLTLAGELDMANVAELMSALDGCDDLARLIVDTSDLWFIDSSGLGALVECRNRIGLERFTLIAGKATLRLLTITGTLEAFGLGGATEDGSALTEPSLG